MAKDALYTSKRKMIGTIDDCKAYFLHQNALIYNQVFISIEVDGKPDTRVILDDSKEAILNFKGKPGDTILLTSSGPDSDEAKGAFHDTYQLLRAGEIIENIPS